MWKTIKVQGPQNGFCLDFNDLLSPSDKKGGMAHPDWLFHGFHGALTDCSLNELLLHGYGFTWEQSRGSPRWVQENLDRCFATAGWLELFPSHKLSNLFAATSHHSPFYCSFCLLLAGMFHIGLDSKIYG